MLMKQKNGTSFIGTTVNWKRPDW